MVTEKNQKWFGYSFLAILVVVAIAAIATLLEITFLVIVPYLGFWLTIASILTLLLFLVWLRHRQKRR